MNILFDAFSRWFGWRRTLAGFFLSAVAIQSNVRGDEAAITSPVPPAVPTVAAVFKPGANVNISGSASAANFQRFRVEWAKGRNPVSGWTNSGITLVGGGLTQVTNGSLAVWNSSSITQADYYSIRVLVDTASVTNEGRTFVYFEPDLYSTNWPQWLDEVQFDSSVQPVRTGSGQARLVMTNPGSITNSRISLFGLDGSRTNFVLSSRASNMQPATGDLDGIPGDEIVVAELGFVRSFQANGAHSYFLPNVFRNFQVSLVTLANLDGSSLPEIVALARDLGGSSDYLFAWRTNGQFFSTNYPVQIPSANFNLRSFEYNRVVPFDLDADGIPELLVVGGESDTSFSLHLLRADGSPAPWPTQVVSGTFQEVAVGDLDDDGSPEIVLAYADAGFNGLIQVYSASGTTRPGWPVPFGSGTPIRIALADLDRDGRTEVIATAYDSLYVFKPDGTLYPGAWPLTGNGFNTFSVPIAADVDGDGLAEIVVIRDNLLFSSPSFYKEPTLFAYRGDGTVARSWILMGANGDQPAGLGCPLFGDFDGDGNAELAVNYSIIAGGDHSGFVREGVLTVLRLGVPYQSHVRDWAAIFHDSRNSAAGLIPTKPRLTRSGSNLKLSWPLQPETTSVVTATNLQGPWIPLTGLVTLNNGIYSTTIQASNDLRSFRLRY